MTVQILINWWMGQTDGQEVGKIVLYVACYIVNLVLGYLVLSLLDLMIDFIFDSWFFFCFKEVKTKLCYF